METMCGGSFQSVFAPVEAVITTCYSPGLLTTGQESKYPTLK